MKKLLALTIALTACMVSCGDDDGKGNTVVNNYYFNGGAPTKESASNLVSNVASVASEKAPSAAPGSKEWCDAVADTVKASDALVLTPGAFDDDALSKQIAALEQAIEKCESDPNVSSFDWYTDAKKEIAVSCNIPANIKMKDMFADLVKTVMGIDFMADGGCDGVTAKMNALFAKYPNEVEFMEMLYSSCDPAVANSCDAADACRDQFWPADMDDDAYDAKLTEAELCADVFDPMQSDPCVNINCKVGEFCYEGQCVGFGNVCDTMTCPADSTCANGFCVPNEPVSKSCTEDPSICGANQHCDGGRCVPNSTQNDCAKYTQAIAAIEAAVLAYNGNSCDDLDEATFEAAAATGVGEDVMEECADDWFEALSAAAKQKGDSICASSAACDPTSCTGNYHCEGNQCVPNGGGELDCNSYPTVKSTMIDLLKSINSCDDLTMDIFMPIITAAAADGMSMDMFGDVMEVCSEVWASSLSPAEQQEIAEKAEMFEDCELDLGFGE